MNDIEKILPYVVPPSYVENQAVSPTGLVRHLGHDVYSMLVHDLDGVCRNVLPGELPVSADEAYERAIANQEALLKTNVIDMSLMQGPRGKPFVVAGGHWNAAACLLLPRLHEVCAAHITASPMLAAVPSRSSLLVFGYEDEAYLGEMRKLISKAESGETKLISNSLFEVVPGAVKPFGELQSPPKVSFLRRWLGT